ncbi:MAG: ATP-binding protein [Bacteroidales bacterium]|nr:ATP-binding protein [Bacteroidales bacterium]
MLENPFILEPFKSKAYFCDREKETEEIIRNITNGRNTTLISPRRLGKTGLIFRVFDEMKERKLPYETIYCDISDTLSIEAFIKVISEAVVGRLGKQQKITAFFKTLKSVRPLLGIDPLTGSPQVSFTFADDNQKQSTLKEVLGYLESYPQMVVLAIDEFQQIREYGDVNMEAILRKHIQHLHNVRFIFCGSKKHTMTDMFTNAKKPFYESTAFLYLSKLPIPVYSAFIKEKFALAGKTIDDDSIGFIIEWTKDHTYYTQRLCNEVFSLSGEAIGRKDIVTAIQTILDSERDRFQEIRRLVTRSQWKMLAAIAMEDSVSQITSAAFLSKYKISSGPTALRNIKALIDKELVLATTIENGTGYSVYNVFLSRFLANNIQHLRP